MSYEHLTSAFNYSKTSNLWFDSFKRLYLKFCRCKLGSNLESQIDILLQWPLPSFTANRFCRIGSRVIGCFRNACWCVGTNIEVIFFSSCLPTYLKQNVTMDRIDCRSQNFDLRQTIFKQTNTHFICRQKYFGKLKA